MNLIIDEATVNKVAKEPGVQVEIDGVRTQITGCYPVDECIGGAGMGILWGEDQDTKPDHAVISFTTNRSVAILNVYHNKGDGSIWGIKGIFRKGLWSTGDNDMPLFKVWDRIA